ncbi:MAG TPA: NAD regulator [Caulobacteraceae bacterium]|nr:NAD regulator [Caulobacteraceae bacterium]
MKPPVVIGLTAVVAGMRDGEAAVLTVRPPGESLSGQVLSGQVLSGLPFGPFDPEGHRTFELAVRAFVARQTGFELGYVEQLYTFGDKGRDAPLADVGAGTARVVSVGYLALTAKAAETSGDTAWRPWTRYFPWEDWRKGRPAVIEAVIGPELMAWAGLVKGAAGEARRLRARRLFALDDQPWNDERVLDRYELLYEAGLVPEAARDRGVAPPKVAEALGRPMISDHRRILATGLGRLRGKLRYRPVAFELLPAEFTLSELQRTVEAISGVPLHKQNFRRGVERTGLVEPLGRFDLGTGGRPAELFRFRREQAAAGPASGLSLPALARA